MEKIEITGPLKIGHETVAFVATKTKALIEQFKKTSTNIQLTIVADNPDTFILFGKRKLAKGVTKEITMVAVSILNPSGELMGNTDPSYVSSMTQISFWSETMSVDSLLKHGHWDSLLEEIENGNMENHFVKEEFACGIEILKKEHIIFGNKILCDEYAAEKITLETITASPPDVSDKVTCRSCRGIVDMALHPEEY